MPPCAAVLRSLALGLAVVSAPGAHAGEAVFDFYVSGIRAGEVTLSTQQSGNSYNAASRITTAGLLGAVADFFFDGRSEGRVAADGTLTPVRFAATSKSPRATRATEIEWQGRTPVRVSVEPPRQSAPDPAAQAGALDPVSAGFAVLRDMDAGRVCNTTIDVFDGSRRSRLTLARPQRDGGEIVCTGSYARVEGEAHTLSSQREFPFEVTFSDGDDGIARLQRIETSTRFGLAVVERRG